MATLIGERRRGALPPVATLKYRDPAMWPVYPVSRKKREKCSGFTSAAAVRS
jgi:hypothetical protein